MRVFVTGATGFIGSAIVKELLAAQHTVLGLARSDASADALAATGAEVHRGSLEDVDSLRRGAENADGVIHTAFIHDFSNMTLAGQCDLAAIQVMGDVLAGSNRPLVISSGTALVAGNGIATEDRRANTQGGGSHRVKSEDAIDELATRGVRGSVIRLSPTVHGKGDHGFVPHLINIAREKGAAAYVGDGMNRWPAVHRLDAARLFRLALEKGTAGARYHGAAEEGIPTRTIAETIGRHLNVPVVSKSGDEVAPHFGWIGIFFSLDCPASSAWTRAQLGWTPGEPDLIDDLDQGHYFGR
ncbi:MAG TPA: SDR family oxidoreductase [Gemmatimonadaceae bacterium]|jgi:nucleoside-diphosphate-sugar epimerase